MGRQVLVPNSNCACDVETSSLFLPSAAIYPTRMDHFYMAALKTWRSEPQAVLQIP
jgi:hypothetical protein